MSMPSQPFKLSSNKHIASNASFRCHSSLARHLLERILADDIHFHLHHNRLITDAQYGFVKGRSTELQLLNCSKMWINAIDSNKCVDTVYIDFPKAFDTVSHRKLLHA